MALRTLMILLIFAITPAYTSAATAQDHDERVNYFTISKDVKGDVKAAVKKAKNNNKLALIIMGANWCHDTRSLMESLDDPAMKTALEGYEVTRVNMDQYADALKVVKKYGKATVYETPTVMIIDPKTKKLVNRDTMHQWRDAFKMSLEEKVAYFDEMANPANHAKKPKRANDLTLNIALKAIDAFEEKHADRIEAIYGTLITYIEDDIEGRPENFNDMWGELWELRSTLPDHMTRMRRQVRAAHAAGQMIILTYPPYEDFSWE